MFEKYTEGAIKVVMLAQAEAKKMGHNFVGTEQLLLGVIGQRHGIGACALKKFKVTLKKARKEVELYIGRGTGFVGTDVPFTPRAKRVLELAIYEARDLGQNFVGTEHLLLALIAESDGVALRTIEKLRVNTRELRNIILLYIEEIEEDYLSTLTPAEKFIFSRGNQHNNAIATIEAFSTDITRAALGSSLDPVIGRDKEINDIIAILARRRKNNPILIGEPGVGKTAVAEGLAQQIILGDIPDFMDGLTLFSLDISSVLAGTRYRGEFEERLKNIVAEAEKQPTLLIVIDEIHILVGAGAAEGALDAANILKPALARGQFRCIGATTNDEYRKYIERDPALERRFQPVPIKEPTVETTIEILRGLRSKFECHHTLTYEDGALEQAANLSNKHIPDRFLPDKAIDVLDEAGSRVRLANKSLPFGLKSLLKELHETLVDKENCIKKHDFTAAAELVSHETEVRSYIRIMKTSLANDKKRGITREKVDAVTGTDVSSVISNWTGIPLTKITGLESQRLLKMENELHKRIIGQNHAVITVAKAIRRARVGLRSSNRPIASFIFAGPTGVGKTELTKALTDYMFGNEESMIRLDMSEYMEKHTVAKLIGSPPGYVGYSEGGQLTESVRKKPYSVLLLDEVEKAHPDVFNLLLQILDDGRLTDSKGRVVDFTNTLIIMTTNLGSKVLERESGLSEKNFKKNKTRATPDAILGWEPKPEIEQTAKDFERISDLVHIELKKFFRPEFINRIDDITVFNHLTRTDIWKISSLMIKQVKNRLKEKGIELKIDPAVQALLSDKGFDPLYGARPLRRAIMSYLEDKLAEECLSKTLYPNTQIIVTRKKVEGTLMNYTDELGIDVDFSNVDPNLLDSSINL